MGLCQKWLPIAYIPQNQKKQKHHKQTSQTSGLLAAFLALNPLFVFFSDTFEDLELSRSRAVFEYWPIDLSQEFRQLAGQQNIFNHGLTSWLVGGWPTYPSEKWWSEWVTVGMMKFPTFYGKSNQIPWFQSPPTRYIVIPIISHYIP